MLSNMHTNSNAAHNYPNQHSFALNISAGTPAAFNNPPTEQAPPSNHPVASVTSVSQGFNLQKTNTIPASTTQANSVPAPPTAPPAMPAPVPELPSPEKSQANGSVDSEIPSQTTSPVKEKASLPVLPGPQPTDKESTPPTKETSPQKSSLPSPSKPENKESGNSVSARSTSSESPKETLKKPLLEGHLQKDEKAHQSNVSDKPEEAKPLIVTENEEVPMEIDSCKIEDVPKKVVESHAKVDATKLEPKVEAVRKSVEKEKIQTLKPVQTSEDPLKVEKPVKSETKESKTPAKTTPRKPKTSSAQDPLGTSTPSSSSASAVKRQRIRTQHYQSPLPELEFVSKISTSSLKSSEDNKLIVFYKNEFLAVRNAEGSFYLCQAIQNIYKSSPKIRIRWLSQDKNEQHKKGEVFTPDFYDLIDFDCILTNLSLSKADKGKFVLPPSERARTESILNRSIAVEKGEEISSPSLTEEHPDGLDLSLYKDEHQINRKRGKKRSRKVLSNAAKVNSSKEEAPNAKVRKVQAPLKKEAVKKVVVPSKKKELVKTTTNKSKITTKAKSKTTSKSSPVVDQKKAKVLARISRTTAVASAKTKLAAKNNPKNEKSGKKATTKPQAQAKSSSSRPLRKSSRK